MSAFDNISVETKDTLPYLTVNRPKALNALAVRFSIEAVNRGLQVSQGEGLVIESALFAVCASSEDKKEGTAAFMGKRPARFIGR
jgi:enoyl-CoA hydratase/carnithine racemase